MSDNQRRLIARLAFIFLCLLPTGYVVYQLFHQPTASDWQELVQAKLGWNITIDHLETPVPGTAIFYGIRIQDAAGDIPAELNKVTLVTGKRHQLIIDHPVTMTPEALANLVVRSSDQFTQIGFESRAWQIIFNGGMTVAADEDLHENRIALRPAQIDVQKQGDTVHATMQMRIPSQEAAANPNILTCTLKQNLLGKGKIIEIDTGPAGYLPTQFAGRWVKEVQHLGDSSYFSGQIKVHVDQNQMVGGHVEGMVGHIDLQNLVRPYGHTLRGHGDIRHLNCNIVQSRIKDISGNLSSQHQGIVGNRLLLAAQNHLGLGSYDRSDNEFVRFGNFDFDWRIRDGELSVAPGPQSTSANVIAHDRYGKKLLACPRAHQVPVRQLASFLVPPTSPTNLNQETVALLSRFHLPKARTARLDDTNFSGVIQR